MCVSCVCHVCVICVVMTQENRYSRGKAVVFSGCVPWLMYYMTSFLCVSWINSTESPSEWQYYWVTTYIGIESFHSCENHGAHTGNTTASKSGVLSHDTHVKGVISHTNESRYTPWKHYSIVRQITVLWSHDTLNTHVHTHTHIHTHFATYDMKHVTRVWVMILKTHEHTLKTPQLWLAVFWVATRK